MFGLQQGGAGVHLAMNHSDTTEGAVHCFQDEFGNWHSYSFGTDSTGTANTVNSSSSATSVAVANGSRLLLDPEAAATEGGGRGASKSTQSRHGLSNIVMFVNPF
jgi:hypothetical protein